MKYIISLVFLVGIATQFIYSQDDLILQLFPGKWQMDIANTEIYEEWVVVNDNELIGKSYSVEEGKEVVNEILYIKMFGDQWAYVAVPEGQTVTLFALVEYTPKKFIFENKEHDFPQQIIYEFHKDGKLTAAIEGNVNGEMKRMEFSLNLVEE